MARHRIGVCVLALASLAFALLFASPPAHARGLDRYCGEEDGLALRFDPAREAQYNPVAIADYVVANYFVHQFSDKVRRIWSEAGHRLLAAGPDPAAIQPQLKSPPSREELDALAALVMIHEIIVTLEGTDLSPSYAARLSSQNWDADWRKPYMAHDIYLREFARIAAEYQKQGDVAALASARASVVLRNWFDEQHTGRPASPFDSPDDWMTIAGDDFWLRRMANEKALKAVPKSRTWMLDDYAIGRRQFLACLGFDRANWHELPRLAAFDATLSARIIEGQWCREPVWLNVSLSDGKRALGNVEELGTEAAKAVQSGCPSAGSARLSAWVDQSRGLLYEGEARGTGGWKFSPAGLDEREARFLDVLEEAASGSTKAAVLLSQHYETGTAVVPSPRPAFEWMSVAAEKGDTLAQAELARMYAEGIGTYRSLEEAISWADHAAKAGDPIGLFHRGLLRWPFNSPERFVEAIQTGTFVEDMLGMATDSSQAGILCQQAPYRDDPAYKAPCEHVHASNAEIAEINERLANAPVPEYEPHDYFADPVVPWEYFLLD